MSNLPYPDIPGINHWNGCWSCPGHHNCAMRRIAQLEALVALDERALRDKASAWQERDKAEALVANLERETEQDLRAALAAGPKEES